jgi:hypothetical protein
MAALCLFGNGPPYSVCKNRRHFLQVLEELGLEVIHDIKMDLAETMKVKGTG